MSSPPDDARNPPRDPVSAAASSPGSASRPGTPPGSAFPPGTPPGSAAPPDDLGRALPGLAGAVGLLVVLFALIVLLQGLVSVVGEQLGWPTNVRVDLGLFAPQLSLLLVIVWYLSRARLRAREALPLRPLAPGLVLPLLVTMTGVFALVLGVLGVLENFLGTPDALDAELERLFRESDLWVRWVALAVAAPLLEEAFFRGLVLRGLLHRHGPAFAIGMSSFLFGLTHLHPYRIVVATLLGAHLGWWFYRTRNLTPGIVAHAFVNFTVGCLLPFAFGQEFLADEAVWSPGDLLTFIAGGLAVSLVGFRWADAAIRRLALPHPSAQVRIDGSPEGGSGAWSRPKVAARAGTLARTRFPKGAGMDFFTIRWDEGKVVLLDQTLLPGEEKYLACGTTEDVVAAIQRLSVRGAPAIGVAGAYGAALAAHNLRETDPEAFRAALDPQLAMLREARPTAVNLGWAIDRVISRLEGLAGHPVEEQKDAILAEARLIHEEDVDACRTLGRFGAELIPDGSTVLTHCNAGALATGGQGTALSVVYAAAEAGKSVQVFSDETRPLLQGARLTAWECQKMGVPVTLLCDNAAGWILSQGRVDRIVVGADRIAANGDVANKIGTYPLAVLAREHGVPFYVAAPTSTLDLNTATGRDIPIEERAAHEVTEPGGMRIAPDGVPALNPAFDITPNALVAAIITEQGIATPPYTESLARMVEAARAPA